MDREKVIKAVEEAFDLVHSDYIGTYDFDETEWEQNKADALALLKEQEAEWLEVDDKQDAFDCSNCGAMAGRKCLYCPGCGAKMKNGTRADD